MALQLTRQSSGNLPETDFSSIHIDFVQSMCFCITGVFFYPVLWVEGWVWKAWLTSVRPLGGGGLLVLHATCQRLNDGSVNSSSTQPPQCECARGLTCVCRCAWVSIQMCVFLRSRVNYIGHDVKGRSLVSEITAGSTQQLPWRQRC